MLTLRAGASSLVVAPEYGAGILGWMVGRTPIFRRALPQATAGDMHAMACFPLLPYANRLALGRFRWHDQSYRVTANFGDHPHTIHGVGWQSAWSVAETSCSSATLTLKHQPDEHWPFAFDASVTYALQTTGLTVDIQITNREAVAAPAGLGLHPYFPKANRPSLRFNATGVWSNGPDALPLCHQQVPAGWAHADPRPVAESALDNCFSGWDRNATIIAGPASLRLEASEIFTRVQVFTPPWADFFCVEPVTHVPDALNNADEPMQSLEPGATLAGTVRLGLLA